MRLHEYQAKALFARHGVRIPAGVVIQNAAAVTPAIATLGGEAWVVKAQIHAGGRGRAGGVRQVDHAGLATAVGDLLGHRLVTGQTGPHGQPVGAVLVERPVVAIRELYVACTIDRASGRRVVLASTAGGVDVEDGPAPLTRVVDAVRGFPPYAGRALACALGLRGPLIARFGTLLADIVQLAEATDALLIEINPLMVTAAGELIAADGKIDIDDNALYRQPELAAWRDLGQQDPQDQRAYTSGLQYIALEGDIGCLVNGAGLAMATMDLIALAGGAPANFLDVGGATTAVRVAEALTLLVAEPRVRAVFVNIFGGIVRCDLIAEGLIAAAAGFGRPSPIVVRLVGTRNDEGRALLAASHLAVDITDSLADGARRVVQRAQEAT
ncbi:MAG: ADP-forming succinate--CoA ligase subunit beta [Acidiferrobacter sp.]